MSSLRYGFKNIFLMLLNFSNSLKVFRGARLVKCKFGKYNTIYENVIMNNVELGNCTYVSHSTRIHYAQIGKFCSIGPDSKIGLGIHPSSSFVSSHPAFYSTRKQSQISFVSNNYFNEFEKITIGNDVWIGANVIIMDGVTIGDGAIVAAGSVVTKDIEAYAIYGGVPAKLIKFRFSNDQVKRLLDFKWWEKDLEWLKNNVHKLHNIDDFIRFIQY